MLTFNFSRLINYFKNVVFTKRSVVPIYAGLWAYCMSQQNNFDHLLLIMAGVAVFLAVMMEPFIFDDLKKKHIDILPSDDPRRSDREYDLSKTRLVISFTFLSIFLSLVIFLHVLYTDTRKNLSNEAFQKNKVETLERKSSNVGKDHNENARSH